MSGTFPDGVGLGFHTGFDKELTIGLTDYMDFLFGIVIPQSGIGRCVAGRGFIEWGFV